MILKNIIPYFFRKLGKMSQIFLSAAVVIGALRVKFHTYIPRQTITDPYFLSLNYLSLSRYAPFNRSYYFLIQISKKTEKN